MLAWRQHLKTINNAEKEEQIYQTLKVLVDETNQNKFDIMFENAIITWKLDNETKSLQSTLKTITNPEVFNGPAATVHYLGLIQICMWKHSTVFLNTIF